MNLLKSAATVSGMTLISRTLGFARDVVIAASLGAGPVTDAFVTAFQFPNLFRRLFAEGAFNAAFVPLFAKRLEGEGTAAAQDFAEQALSLLLTGLMVLTAVSIALMPWIVYVIAPGFSAEVARSVLGGFSAVTGTDPVADPIGAEVGADKLEMTVYFTRVLVPYLIFVSLLALYGAMLNSAGYFALAAAAPVFLNILAIGALGAAYAFDLAPGDVLVWGILVSGLVQFMLVWWGARRAGFRLRLRWPTVTGPARQFLMLGVPGVIAGGITQVNLVIGGAIAAFQDGARSWLYLADRVYQFPLGMIGVAIGIVLLPDLARRLRSDETRGALHLQNRACELSMLLTLPAAVALLAIATPITMTLFERGAFEATDTVRTAGALAVYGLGLPAFVLIKVFSPGFFAREDTKTPMRFAGYSVAINIVASLLLFPWFGHYGIAFATVLASWTNALLLVIVLTERGQFAADDVLVRRLPRILAAALAMGAVLLLADWLVPATDGGLLLAGRLLLLVVAGLATFGAAVLALGGANLGDVRAAVRRAPKQAG